MPDAIVRGRFVWHELMTTDADAAIRFYGQVVGWGTEPFPGMPEYRLWTHGGKQKGGVIRQSEDDRRRGLTPHWLMYVAVTDIDATVRQAGALGAQVRIAPQSVPGVGRYAILSDPQGAMFSLFAPETPGAGSDKTGVGDFSWHELATSDARAAWEFYHAIFGWEKTGALDMGPAGTYQMYRRAGGTTDLGGIYTKPPEMPGPANWLGYAQVPNADRAAALVTKLGGRVLNGPMEVPGGGRIAMCIDPQGAAFAVHSVAVAVAKRRPSGAKKRAAKRPTRKKPAAKKPAATKRPAKRKSKTRRR